MKRDHGADLLGQLMSALSRLAAPADSQLKWVSELGGSLDELGLEFDDVAHAIIGQELVDPGHRVALQELEAQLQRLSPPQDWTPEALLESEKWQVIRSRAGRLHADLEATHRS